MFKKTDFRSFRLVALAAVFLSGLGAAAICPGTYELSARGLKEEGTAVTINVK